MKIAIDVSPIEDKSKLAHRVRGTGSYIFHLKKALLKYYPDNAYIFFCNNSELSNEIDAVHYPYFEPFFISLPLIKKYKTVVTVHDLTPVVFPKSFPVGIKGFVKWQMQKLLLSRVDAIIADSMHSKQDVIKYSGILEEKVHVVYLAASEDFKRLRRSSRPFDILEKYKLPEKFVLYVGDVTWNKNLPRLIEAIRKINVPLVMAGSALVNKNVDLSNPWNTDFAKVLELLDGDKRIIRLGFVSNEELVLLYNAATVFAMPSIYEGFGLPVLEAMSCGCPVVTSKEGSIPEIVQDAAFNVDAYSVDSIAKGIKEVFDNEILQENLSEKGLRQSGKFNWRKTAGETMAVYKKVASC